MVGREDRVKRIYDRRREYKMGDRATKIKMKINESGSKHVDTDR